MLLLHPYTNTIPVNQISNIQQDIQGKETQINNLVISVTTLVRQGNAAPSYTTSLQTSPTQSVPSSSNLDNGTLSVVSFTPISCGQPSHIPPEIVLSEITPYFARDRDVRQCNDVLHKELDDDNKVHIVKLDPLRNEKWSKFKSDRKHIKEEHVKLFASLLIDSLKEAHGLPTRHQKYLSANKHQHQKAPQPLMNNLISMPPYHNKSTSYVTPIGQRLMNIADGSSVRVVQKQNMISKLTEFLKCLEGW